MAERRPARKRREGVSTHHRPASWKICWRGQTARSALFSRVSVALDLRGEDRWPEGVPSLMPPAVGQQCAHNWTIRRTHWLCQRVATAAYAGSPWFLQMAVLRSFRCLTPSWLTVRPTARRACLAINVNVFALARKRAGKVRPTPATRALTPEILPTHIERIGNPSTNEAWCASHRSCCIQ